MIRKSIQLLFVAAILTIGNVATAKDLQSEMEAKIDQIIQQLTLEEKVAMCHAQSKFSTPGVPRLGIPEVWMSDGPHGVRAEIEWDDWGHAGWTNDSITAFPALTCLAATFNPKMSHNYGVAVGEEALYRNKDILLGPGVNIYRTPLNGRNFEYMGEDPFLASVLVVPYIKGLQHNGVAACVKHYALNNQEQWRSHINVEVSDRALYEIYLPAFKAAVIEGEAWSIMGAYNQFRGQYCCHNEILLNKILKEDWGFDGVVVTDWGGAHDTKEAALNGLDMEMGTGTDGLTYSTKNAYDNYYLAIPFLNMLKNGEIEESVVDDKVRRILRLMMRTNMNKNRGFGRLNNQEHLDVAREVANEGIVLLKNSKSFFPINPDAEITIAVIGENATKSLTKGGGSSELKAKHEVSALEGIQNRFDKAKIVYAKGYASGPSNYGGVIEPTDDLEKLHNEAVELAKTADVVLFVGGLNKNHHQDCEGGDRLKYGLPFGQNELINDLVAVNPNMGILLVSGNAVEMPWLSKVKGLMQTWYLGSQAGNAIADVISGDVNPSGKLPFTYPVKLEDNSAHHFGEISYPGDGTKQEYLDDIFVGYRWHEVQKIKPQFAFGYGLSYTAFDIKDARLDKKSYSSTDQMNVSCTVHNKGGIDGAEVIQVYVGKSKSEVKRAVKELKGFHKVMIASGQSETVQITIDVNSLAYYDENQSDWNLEKGNYLLYVGNASNNISQKLKFTIE